MYQIDFDNPIHVYFCGIGGISMSGLAQMLFSRGFTVSGSDIKSSPITDSLENLGMNIYIGQKKENISDFDLFVYTAAISPDNPEWLAVKEKNIPCLTRAQLLGEIMKNFPVPIAVSGTHGKTTTSSMISEILLWADVDPTITIGGILKSIGGNLRIGNSDYFLTEACEYTNSFLSFFPKISVILNIEEDHMDFFKDIDDIRTSFRKFACLLPPEGTLIINGDIPDISEIISDCKCNILTFGSTAACDYYPENITYDQKGYGNYILHSPSGISEISLSVPGLHNIMNSMAALAVADACGIQNGSSCAALRSFTGTDRRFQYKGTIGGLQIIDDYAHHPTEIKATLSAALNLPHNRLLIVFQPHTYSRTRAFLNEFAEVLSLADIVILSDIYAAREKNTFDIHSRDLQKKIMDLGRPCYYFSYFDDIEKFILENCCSGDLLITCGAGDIVKVGENLLGI